MAHATQRGATADREHHMKLLYFDDFKLGVLKGDNTVVDVSAIVRDIPHTGPGDLINGLIERFGTYRAKLENEASGTEVSLLGLRHAPAISVLPVCVLTRREE